MTARIRGALLPLALLGALALLDAVDAGAQKASKLPKRPKLDATADTNDAGAYYRWGSQQLVRDPDGADRAFYWASRIAPSWADPYYGRWASATLLMSSRPSKAESRHADSLEVRAERLNPFLFRRLDRQVLEGLVSRAVDPEYVGEVMFALGGTHGDIVSEAFQAYQSSKFVDAARLYGKAIEKNRKRPWLHEDRAMAFYQLQHYDSAAMELDLFLKAMRASEDTTLQRGYLSKAFAEFQLGQVLLLRGDTAAARGAFGRALAEDLAYAPAHQALAGMATEAHDAAGSLAEAEAAVQSRDDDPVLHYTYARALIEMGRASDAEHELKRAIELEPYFAMPYFLLGRLYDASEMTDEAQVEYGEFVARGSRAMQEYAFSVQRLAQLRAAAPAVSPTPPNKGR